MLQLSSADSRSVSKTAVPQPSYTRLAMRNMVRKGKTSLMHFALTSVGLAAVLVGLAYIFFH
ncbi:DUF3285 domain-containing protein [Synechococcus sp. Nb3U1]|uniref:DUF3285 domain-containing protein n=1 Tax=Synechococcus sp. Nb3U1 TaxID=1914529 RepID=UPI001F36D4ED|nr:DUF3285 domain-containing protein [Synechococcus sp. Nb3U1]MCF2970114.1 DUF3285 domain-containing protein [Synechococcus sp. Nb3U1]